MGVLSSIVFLIRVFSGSLFSALVLSVPVYVLHALLPKPDRLTWKFVVGGMYLLLFTWIAHFAYFLDYLACPNMPDVPNYETDCVGNPFLASVSPALTATMVAAPYLLLFYSAAFFVYYKVRLNSRFLRIYIATLVFVVVMLVWLAVFPWALERYLQLFY